MVLRGLSYVAFPDSEGTIGSKEVGRVGEESNSMDSISVVEFDTRVLRESRQMEIDFANQLDLNCKRSRQWASTFPVIPTKWVDVNGGGAKQLEYCSRLCEKDLKRLSSNVKCAMFDLMSRSVAGATSDVVSKLPTDEQVVCRELIVELSNSLSEIRKETHYWKTEWRDVFVNRKPKSSTVMSCHERELCGLVHNQIEAQEAQGLNFERCADLRVDDGVDKMVTILNRLVTWSNQMRIEANPRHLEVLLARMSMDRFDICIVLCDGCEIQTGTSRNLIVRKKWVLERYVNIEILEVIYIVNCQAEKGLMRAHGSIPCGCVKGSRYRRWLSWIRA